MTISWNQLVISSCSRLFISNSKRFPIDLQVSIYYYLLHCHRWHRVRWCLQSLSRHYKYYCNWFIINTLGLWKLNSPSNTFDLQHDITFITVFISLISWTIQRKALLAAAVHKRFPLHTHDICKHFLPFVMNSFLEGSNCVWFFFYKSQAVFIFW